MDYIGICRDGSWYHLAQIKKSRSSIQILNLQSILQKPSPTAKDVNPLYINGSLKAPFRGKTVVTGLSPHEVLIRKLQWSSKASKAAKKALAFQAESSTSLSPEESITEVRQIENGDSTRESFSFTTSHHAIQEHLQNCSAVSIDPDIVTCYPIALVRFSQLLSPNMTSGYLIHFGMAQTHCVLMKDNMPQASSTIDWGLNDFYQSILADNPQENLEDLTPTIDLLETENSRERLWKFAQKFGNELLKVLHSFTSDEKSSPIPLMLTGFHTRFHKMEDYFLSYLQDLISDNISHTSKEKNFPEIHKYALSLGMILDTVTQKNEAMQFRKHPFVPKNQMQKHAKKTLGFCFGILFLSAATTYSSIEYKKLGKKRIAEELYRAQVLDAKKMHRETPTKHRIPLEQQLYSWNQQLTKEANTFPFILQVPNVSQSLAWLSSIEEGNIDIEDFKYELSSFPSLENLQEPYLVKVAIEFKAPSPTEARKFHDYLLSEKEYIDLEKDFSWEVFSSRYKVSFYLKTNGASS